MGQDAAFIVWWNLAADFTNTKEKGGQICKEICPPDLLEIKKTVTDGCDCPFNYKLIIKNKCFLN